MMYLLGENELKEIVNKNNVFNFGKSVSFDYAKVPYDHEAFAIMVFQPMRNLNDNKVYILIDFAEKDTFFDLLNNKVLKDKININGQEYIFSNNDWWQHDPDGDCYNRDSEELFKTIILEDCDKFEVYGEDREVMLNSFQKLFSYMKSCNELFCEDEENDKY